MFFKRLNGKSQATLVWLAVAAMLLCVYGCGALGQHSKREGTFTFAVLADIQYADKDPRGKRHYRTALQKFTECVDHLNRQKPAFVIQLGDIVDGHADNTDKSKEDLDVVLRVFNRLSIPKYHVVGNHCLTVGAQTLRQQLGIQRFYYDFTVPSVQSWRFVVLDGNAAGYGAMGDEQLTWLRATLDQAARNGEKVICFSHYALLQAATHHHRTAKPEPILKVIDDADCVAAWFAGHDHAGGYAIRNGVHHVTVKGMVEAPVVNAYALVEVCPDKIREIGFGKEPDRDLPLRIHQPIMQTE